MKKSAIRILSVFLTIIMLVSLIPVYSYAYQFSADGNFEYTVNTGNTATIQNYIGSAINLTIPATIDGYTVTDVNKSLFNNSTNVTNIKSLTVENGLENLQLVLTKLSSLEYLKYPQKSDATYNASGIQTLETVIMPQELNYISENSFMGCTALESIEIPDGVISVGKNAFNGCTSLRSIDFPAVTFYAGDSSFRNTGMESLNLDSVGFFGSYAFADNENLETVVIDELCESSKGSGYEGFYDGVIADGAFSGCANLQSVTISTDIKEIGNAAFDGCTNLVSLNFNYSDAESIGMYAFRNCENLEDFVDTDCLTCIGWEAFCGCKNLIEYTIPDTVEYVFSAVFSDCPNLERIYIGSGLGLFLDEGEYPLAINCPNLQEYIVSADNEYLSSLDGMVFNKEKTTLLWAPQAAVSVSLPDSVREIGIRAFWNYTDLETVTANNIRIVNESAFEGCTSLSDSCFDTAFVNVETIKQDAFKNCVSFRKIKLHSQSTQFQTGAFNGCDKLKIVVADCGSHTGLHYAFKNCPNLESFQIKNESGSFFAREGVLYFRNTDGTVDIANYPSGKKDSRFVVPEFVDSTSGSYSITNNPYLVQIVCPFESKSGKTGLETTNCPNLLSVALPACIETMNCTFTNGQKLKYVLFKNNPSVYSYTSDISRRFCDEQTYIYSPNADINILSTGICEYGDNYAYSARITKMPDKTIYNVGEELDLAGLELEVTKYNGETITISDGYNYLYGFDSVNPGICRVVVEYQGTPIEVFVKVVSNSLTYGDTNSDGELNSQDYSMLYNIATYVDEGFVDDDQLQLYDINNDCTVDAFDAVQLNCLINQSI